jgi:hypothetical protein
MKHITIEEIIKAISKRTRNRENMLPASCINSLLVSLTTFFQDLSTVAPNKKPGHLSEPGLVCYSYTSLAQQKSLRITFGGIKCWGKILKSVIHILF